MRNNLIKIIIVAIIIFSSFSVISMVCAADENPNFELTGFEDKENPIKGTTKKTTAIIISAVRIVGVTVAIVMLLVIAMKYMASAPGDRADIKKHAVAYVIGAVILFGVSGILGILVEIASAIHIN